MFFYEKNIFLLEIYYKIKDMDNSPKKIEMAIKLIQNV